MVDIANFIASELQKYTTQVVEALEETQEKVAKEAAKTLRATSPKRPESGRYARSWRVTKKENGLVIHSAKYSRLTHLLEKGHALKSGGRVAPRVHIKPVEEFVKEELPQRLKERLERLT